MAIIKKQASTSRQAVAVSPAKEEAHTATGSQVIVNKTAVGDATNEVITINKFETDTAKVTVSASIKKSDGDYGNAEVFVSLSVPCYVEEIAEIYEATTAKVHAMLDNELVKLSSAEAPTAYRSTDLKDTTVEEESVEEGEEQEITEDDVSKMKKDDLIKLIDDYALDVEYGGKKTLAVLRKEVIAALFTEEEENAAEEEAEEEEVAEDPETEEEEYEPYTKEQLSDKDVTLEDLKGVLADLNQVLTDADLDAVAVKLAKNALPKVVKAAYITAILEAQEAYLEALQG